MNSCFFAVFFGLSFLFSTVHALDPKFSIATENIKEENLKHFVTELASPKYEGRLPGSRGDKLSTQFIINEFKKYGLQPGHKRSYSQSFYTELTAVGNTDGDHTKVLTSNIIGILPGNDKKLKNEIILISAHKDHLGKNKGEIFPGANDDASGVAAMLEIARAFSNLKMINKRTLVFVAFGAEEQEKMGSMHFVKSPPSSVKLKNIIFMTSIDMIGLNYEEWASLPQKKIDHISETWFKEVFNDKMTDSDKYSHEYAANSPSKKRKEDSYDYDAGPFADLKIKNRVFGIADSEHYHEPSDTASTLQYPPMTNLTKAIFHFLVRLDTK